MPQIDDGGPAFPGEYVVVLPNGFETTAPRPGMSLRDYWAGEVVNGELAGLPADSRISAEAVARWGFKVADAMLAERDKPQTVEE